MKIAVNTNNTDNDSASNDNENGNHDDDNDNNDDGIEHNVEHTIHWKKTQLKNKNNAGPAGRGRG